MTTIEVATRQQGSRHAGAVRRQLNLFPQTHRQRVSALAHQDARLADLAISFPALLFALAVPRAGFDPADVILRVCAGEALKPLCKAAALPAWLRSVPPQAFAQPLPALPDGDLFRMQIANHIPSGRKVLPYWLSAVAEAAISVHEPFALWIAREIYHESKRAALTRLLCLWAWYSSQPDTRPFALMRRRWSADMGYRAAMDEVCDWQQRLELEIALGDEEISDVWLTPGSFGEYEFVPLRNVDDLASEGRIMGNCVMTYGYGLGAGQYRLWSLRKDGVRIATVQVGHYGSDPHPQVIQLAGPRNEPCSREIWWAVRTWVHGHGPDVVIQAVEVVDQTRPRWARLWKPFWHAKGGIPPWLPLTPSAHSLDELNYPMGL